MDACIFMYLYFLGSNILEKADGVTEETGVVSGTQRVVARQ